MATTSGGSKPNRKSGSSRSSTTSGKRKTSTAAKRKTSTAASKASSTAKRKSASTTRKASSGSRKASTTAKRKAPSAAKRKTPSASSRRTAASGRSDKSVAQFRDALERSRAALESNVNVSRDRLQEVVDDSVKRGRMTRADANELVSNLVSRGRQATDDLIRDLERLIDQARKGVDTRTAGPRRQATLAAERVGRVARDAADRPLAEADKLRRRAGGPGAPITGYEQLTASQIKSRLSDLNKAELRKVRTAEKRGKARKGILDAIEKRLES